MYSLPKLPLVSLLPGAIHFARAATLVLVWQLVLSPILLPERVAAQSSNLTPISVIQGAGMASAYDGQKVMTWGVVTGVTGDGFYLQDPIGDGDPMTSEGIFAFTYDAPTVTVGECLQVAGEVAEYFAKSELNWMSAITPSDACGVGQVMPVMLPAVRPGDDAAAKWEAFEGMVVQLAHFAGHVHGPTKRFAGGEAEIAFLPDPWQRYFGAVHLFHDQEALSGLLYLSNRLGVTLPSVQWGDRLHVEGAGERGGLIGVLDYNFGKYQLLPLPGHEIAATVKERVAASLPPARGDEYGICSYNLHGLGRGTAQFPNDVDYGVALRQRASTIATHLSGCTVLALQETGQPQDAHALAAILATEHGLVYDALAIEGAASYESEFPLTNSILVDRSRVTVELVDGVTGCSPQDYGIVPSGECPLGEHPVFDRPPLMAKLLVNGQQDAPQDAQWQSAQTVWVIDNHWKSKSGDESANARLRAAQATVVAERVQAILATDANAQIVVLGDLNDFYGGAAISTLQNATGLFHPYEWLPPLQRYTYLFNGAAQVLDHALVTPNLVPQLALVQILHIHADAPAGDSSLAHSDHDPVVLRMRPAGGAAHISGTLLWGEVAVRAVDSGGHIIAQATTDANGDFRLWGIPAGTLTLQFDAPDWIIIEEPTHEINALAGMITPEMPTARHTTALSGVWLALNTPLLAEMLIP